MSNFLDNFSSTSLLFYSIKLGFWSCINLILINWIYNLDYYSTWSETGIAVICIPVGIVNCMVFINGFYQLRNVYWKTVYYAIVSVANFVYFISVWNDLKMMSGNL